METKLYQSDNIIEAAKIISEGGLIAFPTETVYGLGGNAKDKTASARIYAAKGRPSDNPLIVHIADYSQLEEIADELPENAKKLADAFWPGPLTMVVKKNNVIPYETTGGLDTVAVRMPSHPVALELIKKSNCMIAAPSANTSGRPSPTKAKHVYEDLKGKIEGIIDGGAVDIGLESTIVDLTEDITTVLRPGYITIDMLEQVVGQVQMDPGLDAENVNVRPKAPGMRYRHYAPKASLTVVQGENNDVIKSINDFAIKAREAGDRVGVIATAETKELYKADEILVIGSRDDEEEIAHNLYDILRKFDEKQVDLIYSESFSKSGVGSAIMNRLLKAAGHQIIEV